MNDINNKPNKYNDHGVFPAQTKDLTDYFGQPTSEEEQLYLEYFKYTFPLIKTTQGLGLVRTFLDKSGNEFCAAFTFDPEFISSICQHGFYPMSTMFNGKPVLLIKAHRQRCILILKNLHISRKAKKKSHPFTLTVDKAFDQCLTCINEQHDDNWLYPPLAESFKAIFYSGQFKTRLHSIELWEKDILVAGEIGFVVGGSYASLSGFYNKDSAGTIQMCATGKLLMQCGFVFWDLGMSLEYKLRLGANVVQGDRFLQIHRTIREKKPQLVCKGVNARKMIDGPI